MEEYVCAHIQTKYFIWLNSHGMIAKMWLAGSATKQLYCLQFTDQTEVFKLSQL